MRTRRARPRTIHMDAVLAASYQRSMRRCRKKQRYISLSRVVSMTPDAARVLLDWDNGFMDLDGFTELPGDVAEVLADFPGSLLFDGLHFLTDEAAKGLAKHMGHLSLEGVPMISTSAARLLTSRPAPRDEQTRRRILCLAGLRHLDLSTAKALANYDGELVFGHRLDLSPTVLAALAKHAGLLTLWIGALSKDGAEALARHAGNLQLFLGPLTDEAAEALAEHRGDIKIGTVWPHDCLEANTAFKKYRPSL
jgi:hypothetical protein